MIDIDLENGTLDDLDLKQFSEEFRFKIIPQSIARALNRAATAGRTQASKSLRADYTAKAAAIKSGLSIRRATKRKAEAVILGFGSPLPLSSFSARQTRRGLSVNVKRSTGRHVIKGGFKGSGSLPSSRFFHRTGEPKRVPSKGRYAGTNTRREPIAQLFGPSVPQMLKNAGVENAVLERASEVYVSTLESDLKYRIGKAADKQRAR